MAVAGRVAVKPRGEYKSDLVYDRLDMVRYDNKVYVAKKPNTSIVPTGNEEYWMLSFTNEAPEHEEILYLPGGGTSVSFEVSEIPGECVIRIQTSIPDVSYTNIEIADTSINVSFKPQDAGMYIKLLISTRYAATGSYTETEPVLLEAGQTEVSITSPGIKDDSIISIYTDNPCVNYKSISVNNGAIGLSFEVQETNIYVKAVVENEMV